MSEHIGPQHVYARPSRRDLINSVSESRFGSGVESSAWK